MDLLIRAAKIIDSNSSLNEKVMDLLIVEGKIISISKDITNNKNYRELTLDNLHVSIGWMDLRANFCDPGNEHKEDLHTGLRAAAYGGFTSVVLMPDTNPVVDTKSGIEYVVNKGKGNIVDVYPAGSLSYKCEGKEIAEMYDMHVAGAVAFTDNKNSISSSSLLNRALLYGKPFHGLVMHFPNDKDLSKEGQMNEGVMSTQLGLKGIPSLAEALIVKRDIELAEYCDVPIHLTNISTKASVESIREAKARGIQVTADVNSYHLLLDESSLEDFDGKFKVMPPLRSSEDIKALMEGLEDGTIDVICSDHTPEDVENKQCELDHAAFGVINLQTSFAVLNTALESQMELPLRIEKVTTKPRNLLDIQVPQIKEGEEANLTLFNPDEEWEIKEEGVVSKAKNTPFIGKRLIGRVYGIVNNGQIELTDY